MTNEPRKSASVILLREGETGVPETFLVRRSEKSASMGGFYVCPGGTVDEEDWKFFRNCVTPEKLLIPGISLDESLARRMAAVRELFEETGILLAYYADKDPESSFSPADEAATAELAGKRLSLLERRISFARLMNDAGLVPALHRLIVYARWITPEFHTIRFDNCFFLASCPEDQEATPDCREITRGLWLSIPEALSRNLEGTVPLSPPTMATLEDLCGFATISNIYESFDGKTVDPVRPVFISAGGQNFVVFPWDGEFGRFQAGEIGGAIDHGRLSTLGDRSTRAVFRTGRAIPYCKT